MNEKLKLMTIKTCKLIVAKPLNIVILSELSKNGPMTKNELAENVWDELPELSDDTILSAIALLLRLNLKFISKNKDSEKNILLVESSLGQIEERILKYFKYAKDFRGMYVDVYPDVPKKLIKDKGIKAGYMSKRSMNEMINYCEEFTALIKKKLEE